MLCNPSTSLRLFRLLSDNVNLDFTAKMAYGHRNLSSAWRTGESERPLDDRGRRVTKADLVGSILELYLKAVAAAYRKIIFIKAPSDPPPC